MKRTKSILAVVLALAIVLVSGIVAFAASTTYRITVTNPKSNISINGNEYAAYKIFDATYDNDRNAVAYTVNKDFAGFAYEGKTGEDLIVYLGTLENDSEALDAFAKAALKYAKDNGIAPAGKATAADEKAVIGLDSAGYYLVTGTAVSEGQTVTAACSLTTAKPTAEVNVKADAPSVDKKITEGEKEVDANNAAIGDKVSYKITSKVPEMKGYSKYFFVMEDTLSKGLTFNNDVVITIGEKTLAEGTDYTLSAVKNADGTTSIEIVFKNFIQYKDVAGAAITVTYSATVNQDASLDPVAGNTNDVKLIYSNDPNTTGNGDPENPDKPGEGDVTGETPKSEVKTFVTGIKVIKVDGKDKSPLTGAKFEMTGTEMKVVLVSKEIYKESANGTYYMLKDGTYTTSAPVTDKSSDDYNADKYDSISTLYEKVTVVDKTTVPTEFKAVGYVDANGVLTFEGLGEGTYVIKELVAPNGYNLLKEEITVTITADASFEKCVWTVVANGETLTANAENLFEITVENNKGTELPSTGGIGTTIFYIVGAVLVAAAGILLITRKRMSKVAD